MGYAHQLSNEEKREALTSFNEKGYTPDPIVVRALLAGITDGIYVNSHGIPLAAQAAMTGSIETVKEYINAGVNIHSVYEQKVNISFWAVLSESPEMIDFLHQQNVDFNKGALRLAIHKENRALIDKLMEVGANPFVASGSDMTPYSKLLLDSTFSPEESDLLAKDMKSRYGSDITPFDLQAENLWNEEVRRNTGTSVSGVSKYLIQEGICAPLEAQQYLATKFIEESPSLLSTVLNPEYFVVDPSFRLDLISLSLTAGVSVDYVSDTLTPEDFDAVYSRAYARKNVQLLNELEDYGYKPSDEIKELVSQLKW